MNKLFKKNELNWLRVTGPYRKKWWMKLFCWLFKHQYKRVGVYGIVYKQCKRCGKEVYNKRAKELDRVFYGGEIGNLYGVRFITSKKVKNIKALDKRLHK